MKVWRNPCPICGRDMGRKGYCSEETLRSGLRHFDKVEKEREEKDETV